MSFQFLPVYKVVIGDLKCPYYFTDMLVMADFQVWATRYNLRIHSVTYTGDLYEVAYVNGHLVHPHTDNLNVQFSA